MCVGRKTEDFMHTRARARASEQARKRASEREIDTHTYARTYTHTFVVHICLNMKIDVTHAPMYKIDATNTRKNRPETF